MNDLIDHLRGKKTYFVAAAMGVLAAAFHLKWIDQHTYETLLGLLASAGLMALRAGVAKVNDDDNILGGYPGDPEDPDE